METRIRNTSFDYIKFILNYVSLRATSAANPFPIKMRIIETPAYLAIKRTIIAKLSLSVTPHPWERRGRKKRATMLEIETISCQSKSHRHYQLPSRFLAAPMAYFC